MPWFWSMNKLMPSIRLPRKVWRLRPMEYTQDQEDPAKVAGTPRAMVMELAAALWGLKDW